MNRDTGHIISRFRWILVSIRRKGHFELQERFEPLGAASFNARRNFGCV